MQKTESPPILAFIPAAFCLMLIGWGGLFLLIQYNPPTVWPRWLFFFLSVLAVCGTALPVVAFLNRRFTSKPAASTSTIMRQSLWFGIYFPTLAWLRMPRVLTPASALLIAIGIIVVEALLRLRERSQWAP